MTKDREDQDPSEFMEDIAHIAASFIDNNSDLVDAFLKQDPGGTRFNMDGGQMNAQAGKEEDRIFLAITNGNITPSDVKITSDEDKVVVRVGEKRYVLQDLPDDTKKDQGSMKVNNGVLTVEFPRGESGDDDDEEMVI